MDHKYEQLPNSPHAMHASCEILPREVSRARGIMPQEPLTAYRLKHYTD
jgi:hypothetical protein